MTIIRATPDNKQRGRAWTWLLLALFPLSGCHSSDASNTALDITLPEHMTHTAFISTLDARQRAVVHRPFDDSERTDWTYTPWDHSGLPLSELDDSGQLAALALVRNAMTAHGFEKAQQVRMLEAELQRRSSLPFSVYDPNRYYTTIFGNPGEGPWSWRFEGHHLSINLTWLDGKLIATTPYFIGAHPTSLHEGPFKGAQPLGFEERIARQLILSLDGDLKQQALINSEPPEDILTGDETVVKLPCCAGVSAEGFNQRQKEFFRAAIELVVGQLDSELARTTLKAIEGDGIDAFYFAWAGSERSREPHYYRIQGPELLIEFDNRGENAEHAHLVWRNPANDFGRDLLGEHYRDEAH